MSYRSFELRGVVERALGVRLSQRERNILGRRLGWGYPTKSQADVARALGTHQPTISYEERELERKLRRVVARRAKRETTDDRLKANFVQQYRLVVEGAAELGLSPDDLHAAAFATDNASQAGKKGDPDIVVTPVFTPPKAPQSTR